MTSILEQRYKVRRQGLSTGKTMLGRAVFHTVARRTDRSFNIYTARTREIEAVITSRHGLIVPDPLGTDEIENCLDYARAVAASLSGQDLHQWAKRWMPWAGTAEVDDIARSVGWRTYMLGADQVARLLGVTLAERERLGLKTIGACDVDKAERQVIAKATKRQRDRERKAEARRAAGVKRRKAYEGQSAEAKKPWLAEGISRRTWYRRQHGTSVSRVEVDNTIGDTPVPPTIGDTPVSGPTTVAAGGRSARPVRRGGEGSGQKTASLEHRSERGAFGHDLIDAETSGPNAALRGGVSTADPDPHRTDDISDEAAA